MEYYRNIGSVKVNKLNKDFDTIIDDFKEKALKLGFNGELKIVKENGKAIFFVKLNP